MKYYFLSLGSNINPFENVQQMIKGLMDISPKVDISRIVQTEAVGFSSDLFFLNMAARISSTLSAEELKAKLNTLETQLGRNRNDANKKLKDRPADIDILFSLEAHEKFVPASLLPKENYVLPTLLDLLAYLKVNFDGYPPVLEGVQPIFFYQYSIGNEPTTLENHLIIGNITQLPNALPLAVG
jgi:2-amino-4-hydroxy-6-hydroxymethyldihydropteridine diphosphokinase